MSLKLGVQPGEPGPLPREPSVGKLLPFSLHAFSCTVSRLAQALRPFKHTRVETKNVRENCA